MRSKDIATDVSLKARRIIVNPPPVLFALEELGVRNKTIAARLGLTNSVSVSNWRIGTYAIPQSHHAKLASMLREAASAMRDLLDWLDSQGNASPEVLDELRHRVGVAERVLAREDTNAR